MHKLLYLFCFLISYGSLQAQLGGTHVFNFLDVPSDARNIGLGNGQITFADSDLSMAFNNPAALNASMSNQLHIGLSPYVADIFTGRVQFARQIKSNYSTSLGIQFMNYGEFDWTNANGDQLGTFSSNELAFHGAVSRSYKRWSGGIDAKFIVSNLETYKSTGLAADIGVLYTDTTNQFSIGMVLKNVGTQLKPYRDENRESLPFDWQIAISKRLKYLPFRLTVTAHHLHQWDIRYNDPNVESETIVFDESPTDENYFFDKLLRHFIFSGEFYFGKVIELRFAYNHLQHQELKVIDFSSVAGLSMGLGFKLKKFRFDYGIQFLHLAAASNHFSFAIDLDSFKKKKVVVQGS